MLSFIRVGGHFFRPIIRTYVLSNLINYSWKTKNPIKRFFLETPKSNRHAIITKTPKWLFHDSSKLFSKKISLLNITTNLIYTVTLMKKTLNEFIRWFHQSWIPNLWIFLTIFVMIFFSTAKLRNLFLFQLLKVRKFRGQNWL